MGSFHILSAVTERPLEQMCVEHSESKDEVEKEKEIEENLLDLTEGDLHPDWRSLKKPGYATESVYYLTVYIQIPLPPPELA